VCTAASPLLLRFLRFLELTTTGGGGTSDELDEFELESETPESFRDMDSAEDDDVE